MTERPRVLLADDHPGVLKAIGRLLSFDCEVVAMVSDCTAALESTARFRPDVVVMDVSMPDIGGLEACRRITQSSPGVKVILVSAAERHSIQRVGLAAGAFAVIAKEEVADQLMPAISSSLR
ncbi:MAG: response regulator [Longimicrobiales bacterium]